ncbi:gamma-glutamyltransferase family protein [Primorskyibacter sp. S187A]|uniref:gamma-glutamyltransferase family protein n=1 Tax=Primorskyibacter sp. S187A TaxID=3415130 RepID=UPI003C79CC87
MRDFHFPGRSPVFATNGMVATSHPLASQTGVDILKRGGSAMDAALGGAVLLGLCEPQMTGLYGDMFALVQRTPDGPVEAYNGSGRAPAGASAARLRDAGHTTIPLDGPDAITIPGAVAAICDLSNTYGTLGLDAILAPAIAYAEAGIPVAPRVAQDWASNGVRLQGHAKTWFLNSGAPFAAGEVFKAPGQAKVLRRIAAHGADGFYTGEVADDILATLTSIGGCHTAEDFAAAKGEVTTPVSADVLGHRLFEHPPNSQGAAAILLLNILSHFDLASMDPFGAARTHIEAEATKLAYDCRNRLLADPTTFDATERMCDPAFAAALAALIDPKRAMPDVAKLTEAVHKDTVYITAVDRDGMTVSLIYSIFHGFGSGHATEKFGLILHNRGAGFTLEAGHPNELAPGKRPMHTIIPGILHQADGGRMPFGVMGGQYQSCGHARVLTNMHVYGMDPQTALDAPRSFAEGNTLSLERGYSSDVCQELADMGHTVEIPEGAIGGAQAIRAHPSGVLEGASDPRKDGCALGY